jgi:hypothetical protein
MIADSVPPTEAKHNQVHRVEAVGWPQESTLLDRFRAYFALDGKTAKTVQKDATSQSWCNLSFGVYCRLILVQ